MLVIEIVWTTDLLARLVVGWELTGRRQIESPADVQPFVARPNAGQDVGNQVCNTAAMRRPTSRGSRHPPAGNWHEDDGGTGGSVQAHVCACGITVSVTTDDEPGSTLVFTTAGSRSEHQSGSPAGLWPPRRGRSPCA